MHGRWTNLILHTSALIHNKKKNLLISHAFGSIYNILSIIVLEIFFGIISFPLYLTSKEEDLGGRTQYKIRRIITLSFLIVVLVVWFIKLIIIVGIPLYFDTRQFQVVSDGKEDVSTSQESYILPYAYAARIESLLQIPVVENIKKTKENTTNIEGRTIPNSSVVINIGRQSSDPGVREKSDVISEKVYVVNSDGGGYWNMTINTNKNNFSPGTYWVRVFAYDHDTHIKSEMSNPLFFSITDNWYKNIVTKIDIYINYFIVIFLTIGIISIILLI